MSSIDLVILGMVLEKPRSAYELQKDVEYHRFSMWTRVSVPSIYRKARQLREAGYLRSETVKGERFADKAIYSITEEGKAYFEELMTEQVSQGVPLVFDFNVVIANLNKVERSKAMELVAGLRDSITASKGTNDEYLAEYYSQLPLVGRTIFDQQQLLYRALLEWLDQFEQQFNED